MNTSRVSIIVTSYNHIDYLEQRINSVISQTYSNKEIIIIDDCSTQDNVKFLQRYKNIPNITLHLNNPNKGLVPTINQGIELSSGDYILIAQCDDDCETDMVSELIDVLDKHPNVGIAFCRSNLIDAKNNIIGNDYLGQEVSFRKRFQNNVVVTGKEMSRYLLKSCVLPNLSGILIRKSALEKAGTFKSTYNVCVDWEFFFRMAEMYDFGYISEPLNKFRQHEVTIRSSTNDKVIYDEYFHLLLGKIRTLNLSYFEKCKYRTHVMYLWSLHILSNSWVGARNIPFHAKKIWRYDAASFFFIIFALIIRCVEICKKIFGKHFQ